MKKELKLAVYSGLKHMHILIFQAVYNGNNNSWEKQSRSIFTNHSQFYSLAYSMLENNTISYWQKTIYFSQSGVVLFAHVENREDK